MAFFQETPRSLRAYLLLVGVLGTVGQVYRVLSSEGRAFARFSHVDRHRHQLPPACRHAACDLVTSRILDPRSSSAASFARTRC